MRKCFLCHVNVPAKCSHYCKPVKPIKAKTMADVMTADRHQCVQCGSMCSCNDGSTDAAMCVCCDYVSPDDQKRNDAMQRGDYLRDRAKDELMELQGDHE